MKTRTKRVPTTQELIAGWVALFSCSSTTPQQIEDAHKEMDVEGMMREPEIGEAVEEISEIAGRMRGMAKEEWIQREVGNKISFRLMEFLAAHGIEVPHSEQESFTTSLGSDVWEIVEPQSKEE